MRILYITYYYFPHLGGGTWSTYNLASRLSKRNDVLLLAPNIAFSQTGTDGKIRNGISLTSVRVSITPHFRLPRLAGPFLSAPFLFLAGLRVAKLSDAIFCQYHPHHFVFILSIFLGRLMGIPVIARADDVYRELGRETSSPFAKLNLLYDCLSNVLNESMIRHATSFLVVCTENKRILESRLGRLNNIGLSHNGFDPAEFEDIHHKDLRVTLGIDPRASIVLFVGRFSGSEYKTDILLEAFEIIRIKKPQSILLLVGDFLHIPLKPSIEQHTRIIGPVSRADVRKYLSIADVCVGPLGPTYALPLKVLEYMAAGKPVVTGIHSVSTDLAINGFNCLCVKPEPEAVAEAVLTILENGEVRSKLISNARAAIARFSWDQIEGTLEQKLLDSTRMN